VWWSACLVSECKPYYSHYYTDIDARKINRIIIIISHPGGGGCDVRAVLCNTILMAFGKQRLSGNIQVVRSTKDVGEGERERESEWGREERLRSRSDKIGALRSVLSSACVCSCIAEGKEGVKNKIKEEKKIPIQF